LNRVKGKGPFVIAVFIILIDHIDQPLGIFFYRTELSSLDSDLKKQFLLVADV
jgi:hypothetical protein